MAVLLGEIGNIELRRTDIDGPVRGTVRPSDVNPNRNRFSFDFKRGIFVTGDQVEIKTTDGTLLSFIDASGWASNQVYKDGLFYIFVDELGSIRLYKTFDDAISGEETNRVSLTTPDRDIPIKVTVKNSNERILGQISSYEINTQRDALDITELSDEFKREYSGLISGSGRITCFFDYERRLNDPTATPQGVDAVEVPIYLNQLILRTKVGSEFWAKAVLVSRGAKPYGQEKDFNDEVWYEFYARITNVSLAFAPGEPIETTVEFVTTGEIALRSSFTSSYLLQEQGTFDRLEQEENQSGLLQIEQED
jgi:hypothetical protein